MLNIDEILYWLRETDPERLEKLWARADKVRAEKVGRQVHLRGLVEISNYCVRSCRYCGIACGNKSVARYRMEADEIVECAGLALEYGFGTIVMQAGEDYGLDAKDIAGIISRIKEKYGIAVTLSLGERPDGELEMWKNAGADRYLLRFETSDSQLYQAIHPDLPGRKSDRFAILRKLQSLGYETGSGVMTGIPGQSYESLARDIEMFGQMDLDMVGIGPYIPHPGTDMAKPGWTGKDIDPDAQVPRGSLMTFKAVALTRLVCPEANLPSTTAVASIDGGDGRKLALARGANVIMPNLTPEKYRRLYDIYPDKACLRNEDENSGLSVAQMLESIGRVPGTGAGGRFKSGGA